MSLWLAFASVQVPGSAATTEKAQRPLIRSQEELAVMVFMRSVGRADSARVQQHLPSIFANEDLPTLVAASKDVAALFPPGEWEADFQAQAAPVGPSFRDYVSKRLGESLYQKLAAHAVEVVKIKSVPPPSPRPRR